MSNKKSEKKDAEPSREPKPARAKRRKSASRDFMEPGLDFDEPTTALWRALLGDGQKISIRSIAAAIADGADPNGRNEFGVSLLLLAIQNDDPEDHPLIRMLFEAGASLTDARGKTPEMDYAKKLLDTGATYKFLTDLDQARKDKQALERVAGAGLKSKSKPSL